MEEQNLFLFMFNEWKHGLKLLLSISNYTCITVEKEKDETNILMKSYAMTK